MGFERSNRFGQERGLATLCPLSNESVASAAIRQGGRSTRPPDVLRGVDGGLMFDGREVVSKRRGAVTRTGV